MKRISIVSMVLWLIAWGGACCGADVQRFEMRSETVGATYTIEVVLPAGAAAGDARYPVVYCLDWYILGDYLQSLPKLMDMGRLTEPFVMVGISQPGGMHEWATTRTRDFTPGRPTDDYSKQNTYPRAVELAGGMTRFSTFLKNELVPRIEASFPADPSRRCLMGYSLGGLMGTCVLAQDPQLFQYYLIGSPSLWYNDFGLAVELDKLTAEKLRGVRGVYLSVGDAESWEMLKGYGLLRDALMKRDLREPQLKAEIIPDSGHVGGMPISLYNGLRFLFRRK
ncbi:MAG TPA: alpha/beta hydrolase-fold protein [Acidobacteriota bacterium]|nr:alpha/beta hydrolase-fold protein [Acidobacteriota bacterium]HQG92360.1 alpha/beta hydrolase-fold protein [Acidobacteriota bacterium]HQK88108.1 alpha/beta hydrolase-fold protein [Acidobacteriota bacterium]